LQQIQQDKKKFLLSLKEDGREKREFIFCSLFFFVKNSEVCQKLIKQTVVVQAKKLQQIPSRFYKLKLISYNKFVGKKMTFQKLLSIIKNIGRVFFKIVSVDNFKKEITLENGVFNQNQLSQEHLYEEVICFQK
jgi:hypothetical protein